MQAYGAYVPILREEFAWSSTALAGGFSLQRILAGLLGPAQGWLLDRFGPRNVMRVGMTCFGTGFILLSQINSLLTFYLVLVLVAFGFSLGGFMSVTTAVVNWFERRRATAMGIMQTGGSIGGLLVPAVAWSLATNGWRTTAIISGLIILLVGLPLTQLMRSRPEDYGERPDGDGPVGSEEPPDPSGADRTQPEQMQYLEFTVKQAIRTRAFWCISLGHALAMVVVSAVMVHLIVHLNDGLGYSLETAALFVSLMTAITMTGQLTGGYLGDKFDKRRMAALAMLGHAVGLIVLAYASNLVMVLIFTVAHGLAWGMRGPLMQAIRADYFGRRSFARIMGFSMMIVMLGQTGGPLVAGLMADRFGNYQLGFTVLGLMAGVGSVFFLLATKPEPPGPRSVPIRRTASP